MHEYLLVAKVIEPVNFREAITKVAQSIALIDKYEGGKNSGPSKAKLQEKAKENKPLREQIAQRLEEEKRRKFKQAKQV